MTDAHAPDPLSSASPSDAAGSGLGGAESPGAAVWIGEVTWREVASLREELFDRLDTQDAVTLDVRLVTVIDRNGVALLIGANHRAHAMGLPLTLIALPGPVTTALSDAHVISDFTITEMSSGSGFVGEPGAAPESESRPGAVADSDVLVAAGPAFDVRARDAGGLSVDDGLDPGAWTTALQLYLDALWQGERSAATAVALALFHQGAPSERVINDLLAQAQRVVGNEWHQGRWSVAGEHRATSITESVLYELGRAASLVADAPASGSRGQTAVVSGEGEWHTLPALMATSVLRQRGVHVTYVAPSLPAEDLVDFLVHEGPTVVAVTCSSTMNLVGAWRSITALRAGGMTVVCGGQGFGRDGRWGWTLGADQWAPDLTTGADRVLTAIDSRPHPPRGPVVMPRVAQEMLVLRRDHGQLLLDAIRVATRLLPGRVGADAAQAAVGDMIDEILHVVASAALVGDPSVATSHVAWAEAGLRARSLPVDRTGVAFASVLAVLPSELVHTRAMALTGSAACGRTGPLRPPAEYVWAPPTA